MCGRYSWYTPKTQPGIPDYRGPTGLARRATITQDVDGLHQAAGASEVIELHGSLHRVICPSCGQRTARADLGQVLTALVAGLERR